MGIFTSYNKNECIYVFIKHITVSIDAFNGLEFSFSLKEYPRAEWDSLRVSWDLMLSEANVPVHYISGNTL